MESQETAFVDMRYKDLSLVLLHTCTHGLCEDEDVLLCFHFMFRPVVYFIAEFVIDGQWVYWSYGLVGRGSQNGGRD